ncbi:hypothetical protein VCHA53O466_320018 [Vibrio chagasii]|nr:hypothetical protein VCHA53O466_320018 [Vibrio chagasii]
MSNTISISDVLPTEIEAAKRTKNEALVLDKEITIAELDGGLTLKFTATDDDTPIDDHFGRVCGWTHQAVNGLKRRLANGNIHQFTAKVHVTNKDDDELGCAYLGSCFYKSISDFMKGGYWPQMAEEALKEALA